MKLSILAYIIIFAQTFIACTKNENNDTEKTIINYVINDEVLTDTPGKTQILSDIIIDVKDSLTKDKIEDLLNHLFQERINRNGFQYREYPNSVAIYAYLSKERAESEAGQWIAMIAKMPMDSEAKITFNDFAINSLNEKEVSKWNLSYKQRHDIWNEIILAERSSFEEADNAYPINSTMTEKDLMKNVNLADELKLKKENDIIIKHKINRETLDSIGLEGVMNDWAFPKK